jgi:hypothetical protein
VEEQLPPPPSPPQLKEAQPDGVSRPNSVDRVLHPDGSQHVSHETLNKVRDANATTSLIARNRREVDEHGEGGKGFPQFRFKFYASEGALDRLTIGACARGHEMLATYGFIPENAHPYRARSMELSCGW